MVSAQASPPNSFGELEWPESQERSLRHKRSEEPRLHPATALKRRSRVEAPYLRPEILLWSTARYRSARAELRFFLTLADGHHLTGSTAIRAVQVFLDLPAASTLGARVLVVPSCCGRRFAGGLLRLAPLFALLPFLAHLSSLSCGLFGSAVIVVRTLLWVPTRLELSPGR